MENELDAVIKRIVRRMGALDDQSGIQAERILRIEKNYLGCTLKEVLELALQVADKQIEAAKEKQQAERLESDNRLASYYE